MKSPYFCVYHAQRLQVRESDAISAWSQLMRQGVKAYTECRTSDAYTYLRAAMDIALLRSECESNGIFSELHLLKPAEFLIELQMAEQRFDDAAILLSRLSAFGSLPTPQCGPTLAQFLACQRKHISAVETAQHSQHLLQCSAEREHLTASIYPLRRH